MKENQAVTGLENLPPEEKQQLFAPLLQKQKTKNPPVLPITNLMAFIDKNEKSFSLRPSRDHCRTSAVFG